jgi:Na+-driven multidrug efflux pump
VKFNFKYLLIYSLVIQFFGLLVIYLFNENIFEFFNPGRYLPGPALRDIPGEVLSQMFNNPFSTIYSIVTTAAYWWAIRWISKTAETAGRSYVGFMILSIVCLPIAWIISLTFKNSNSNVTTGD